MFKKLAEIRETGQGSVTYSFEDGTKQVSNINPTVFLDDKGRNLNLNSVMEKFSSSAHDLGAIKFEF